MAPRDGTFQLTGYAGGCRRGPVAVVRVAAAE
jgi:hypothetical protein